MQPFTVQPADAINFAKVWKYKGLAVPIDEIHAQFATDYANVVLKSFLDMVKANAEAAKKKAEAEAAPKVVLAP